MTLWTLPNNKEMRKVIHVDVSEHQRITIAVELDSKTWLWTPYIYGPGAIETWAVPEERDLTAKAPGRAAAKALEYILELVDSKTLPT